MSPAQSCFNLIQIDLYKQVYMNHKESKFQTLYKVFAPGGVQTHSAWVHILTLLWEHLEMTMTSWPRV